MKKIGKIFTLMFALISLANYSLATTTQGALSPVETGSSKTGQTLLLVIGALLIFAVLYISYRTDRDEPLERVKKAPKMPKKNDKAHAVELTEKEEAAIFDNENKNDIPYELEEEEFYEDTPKFESFDLNEENEYEEDDISLFESTQNIESSFEDIDDDISFEKNDFDSTMIFDTVGLNNELDNEVENVLDNEIQEEELEYTEAVEGLEEKIDNLDLIEEEEQDAESFMNELKKYEQNVEFEGFTTESTSKEEPKNTTKKYTKKKEKVEDNESSEIDVNFLSQMEQNMKKDQETRLKKYTKVSNKSEEKTEEKVKKKTTKKTTKKEDKN